MINVKIVHDDYDTVYCAPCDFLELKSDGFPAVESIYFVSGYAIAVNKERFSNQFKENIGFQQGSYVQ